MGPAAESSQIAIAVGQQDARHDALYSPAVRFLVEPHRPAFLAFGSRSWREHQRTIEPFRIWLNENRSSRFMFEAFSWREFLARILGANRYPRRWKAPAPP
jgi:hypothetical protein